jgi:hypothetical protein
LGATCTGAIEQKLMGHMPTTITQHYNRHQEMDTLREGINRLPALLSGAKPAEKKKRASR